jgi:hypothetical protein
LCKCITSTRNTLCINCGIFLCVVSPNSTSKNVCSCISPRVMCTHCGKLTTLAQPSE